eukprot:TRINITY_DN193_c4_g6_i1.p1 TRINITY_DN193_c4_g6~~TRINITY_DN193_c4_g6_i1.p1  ORF type:complete len:569 (+),score=73.91 TRINITY_DN193_c4_g6_i1:75-1781(+)
MAEGRGEPGGEAVPGACDRDIVKTYHENWAARARLAELAQATRALKTAEHAFDRFWDIASSPATDETTEEEMEGAAAYCVLLAAQEVEKAKKREAEEAREALKAAHAAAAAEALKAAEMADKKEKAAGALKEAAADQVAQAKEHETALAAQAKGSPKDVAPAISAEQEKAFKAYYGETCTVSDWYKKTKDLGLNWEKDPGTDDHMRRAERIVDDLYKVKVSHLSEQGTYNVMLLDGKGRVVWCIIHCLKNKKTEEGEHVWDDAAINNFRFIIPDIDVDMCRYHELGIPMCKTININICELLEIMALDDMAREPCLDVLYFNFSGLSCKPPAPGPLSKRAVSTKGSVPELLKHMHENVSAHIEKNKTHERKLHVYMSTSHSRGATCNVSKILQYFDLEHSVTDAKLFTGIFEKEGGGTPDLRTVRAAAILKLLKMLGKPSKQAAGDLQAAIIKKFAITTRPDFLTFALRPRDISEGDTIIPGASEVTSDSALASCLFPVEAPATPERVLSQSLSILRSLFIVANMVSEVTHTEVLPKEKKPTDNKDYPSELEKIRGSLGSPTQGPPTDP